MLRKIVFGNIVGDITRINMKKKNDHVNRSLQNFMFSMIKDTNRIAAKRSLDVMITLFKRRVWNDDRTANVIATACFVQDTKMVVAALKFFLGAADESEEDDETQEQKLQQQKSEAMRQLQYHLSLKGKTKNTKKRQQMLNRMTQKVTRKRTNKNKAMYIDSLSNIHRIHDPQTFAEKLFAKLKTSNEKYADTDIPCSPVRLMN